MVVTGGHEGKLTCTLPPAGLDAQPLAFWPRCHRYHAPMPADASRPRRPGLARIAPYLIGAAGVATMLTIQARRRGVAVEAWPRIERVELSLDLTAPPRLRGRARLELARVDGPRVPLLLNRALAVEAVTSGGRALPWTEATALRSRYHREARPVFVDLGAAPPDGRIAVELVYSGRGQDGSEGHDWRGVLLLAEDELRMSEQTVFYPQVPFAADSPAPQAAPGRVEVRAPAALEVFVPGALQDEARTDGGHRTWTFVLAQPGTLAVLATRARRTEFERDGARIVTLLLQGHEALAEPFATTSAAVLDFFGARWGPASGAVLGIVEFRGRGASYNWAQQGVLAFERGALSGDVPVAKVAHEVAHLWWGQRVPGRGRGERFLSESLAEYASWRFVEHARGPAAAQELEHGARVEWLDAVHGRAADAALADVHFGTDGYQALAYAKGPLVLRAAEHVLGREAVDRALLAYATAGAAGGGTLPQLIEALRREAADHAFELPWLEHSGHAHLTLHDVRFDPQTKSVRGTVRARACPDGEPALLPPALTVEMRAPGQRQRLRLETGGNNEFTLPFPMDPEWVGIDLAACPLIVDAPPVRRGGARLIGSTPVEGQRDVALGPITVRLDYDRELAALPEDAARRIQDACAAARSEDEGHLTVRAASIADQGRTLLVEVADTHPRRSYTLALPGDLEDEGGVPLPEVRLGFTTQSAAGLAPPAVVATDPAVGARGVALDLAAIRVVFSAPMRKGTGFTGTAVRAQKAAGRAWPPIDFGRWLDARTLEFPLRQALAPGTTYALPFGERFEDERGLACTPLVLYFETAAR